MKADSGCQETRDHRRRLLRGSLLHDIGKLVQRASERPAEKKHAEYGADWLEEIGGFSDILDLVRYHHSWDDIAKIPLLTILCAADALAAGERLGTEDEKKLKWEREMPLLSLFCKVALPGKGKSTGTPEAAKAYYYPVRDASKPNYPLPLEELRKAGLAGNRENYRSLLDGLQRDLDELLRAMPGTLGQGEECDVPLVDDYAILFLLEKHLQYVPGHTYRPSDDPMRDPDISLYDHSRLTAAVALCLFDYFSHRFSGQKIEDWPVWDHVFKDSEKEAGGSGFNESFFLEDVFVYADINLSGIQDFLYNISTRKAARSLRARSFFLEMICEDLAQEAIDRLSLSRCNVVFTGGGRARLLLPNIPKSIEVLEEVERGANLYCRERLGGALSVNVSWVELKPAQFVIGAKRSSGVPSIGDMMMELSRKASRRKEDRLIEEITGGEAPRILGPLPPLDEECRICHVETDEPKIVKEIDEEEGIIACPVCEALVDLGRRLRSAREVFLAAPPDGADAGGLPLPFSTLFTPGQRKGR
ncbi:MAG: type III-A CRISPR-associated protein Cas10/Csm1 [Candidatus Geothermincolales bacterium]